MTTVEAKRSVSYTTIVADLLALREEVRGTSGEEVKAIDKILSDVRYLELYDRYVAKAGSIGIYCR